MLEDSRNDYSDTAPIQEIVKMVHLDTDNSNRGFFVRADSSDVTEALVDAKLEWYDLICQNFCESQGFNEYNRPKLYYHNRLANKPAVIGMAPVLMGEDCSTMSYYFVQESRILFAKSLPIQVVKLNGPNDKLIVWDYKEIDQKFKAPKAVKCDKKSIVVTYLPSFLSKGRLDRLDFMYLVAQSVTPELS